MIINKLIIPGILDNAGKKPWEVNLLDTMDLWKFGEYKNFTSLNLLTSVLGIPTPKDDIDGSMVADVYYVEKDLPRIALYCEKGCSCHCPGPFTLYEPSSIGFEQSRISDLRLKTFVTVLYHLSQKLLRLSRVICQKFL